MYDELIKRLRETSIDFGESDHVSVMMIEAADAIEDLDNRLNLWRQDKIRRWIPVTERLPEENKCVLCKTDYGMEVGCYRNECGQGKWTIGIFASGSFDVSHWMPLPQPPKEGES